MLRDKSTGHLNSHPYNDTCFFSLSLSHTRAHASTYASTHTHAGKQGHTVDFELRHWQGNSKINGREDGTLATTVSLVISRGWLGHSNGRKQTYSTCADFRFPFFLSVTTVSQQPPDTHACTEAHTNTHILYTNTETQRCTLLNRNTQTQTHRLLSYIKCSSSFGSWYKNTPVMLT